VNPGLAIWKQGLAKVARLHTPVAPPVIAPGFVPMSESSLKPLVRQLFLPPAVSERRRIFFAAAGTETHISHFCECIARTLAEICGSDIAIVDATVPASHTVDSRKGAHGTESEDWHSAAVQVTENVWRIGTEVFESEFVNPSESQARALPFPYVIFAANVHDGASPLFCRVTDGVVLVLTANHTHRESALRAKQILLSHNVRLLGTILENRTFPIPESIYRRL
jgi:hypothetical protein